MGEAPGSTGEQTSAVGNLADLGGDQVLLPQFALKRPEGLFVDPGRIAGIDDFYRFVDRVFSGGARFAGLDYERFQQLLHAMPAAGAEIRLADDVVPFPPERRGLYKGVKVDGRGERAEYLFEPVAIEVREPAAELGGEPKVTLVPAKLDFDEFVADMWGKGLRYGIDAAAVRRVIVRGETTRLEIARWLAPTAGRDATLEEQTEALHRDDSPRILADGRIDLRQFKNRFPQIGRNVRLLKKVPRALGKPGRKVSGEPVEPDLPKDFDLDLLAGPGTRVERSAEADYIVSDHDGFLNLDAASNQVSVTDKMIGREGVSARTTGNLSLSGDEYEEHGEVQERRVVEGKHMTFHADVFGSIVSHGGRITLMQNIAGGQARSSGGEILVAGRASRAVLEAPGGELRVGQAESSLLIADKVVVERAVQCEIIAAAVEIGLAEGCAVAAKSVRIATAGARREVETVVSVLVPDEASFDRRAAGLAKDIAELEAAAAAKAAEIEAFKSQPELANYLALEARLRQGAISLTPAQEEGWRKLSARLAPLAKRLIGLTGEAKKLWEEKALREKALADLAEERAAAGAGIDCAIAAVSGDTAVRRLKFQPDLPLLAEEQTAAIRAQLRAAGDPGERLFAGDAGEFAWAP